jgi:hypothetical protein
MAGYCGFEPQVTALRGGSASLVKTKTDWTISVREPTEALEASASSVGRAEVTHASFSIL